MARVLGQTCASHKDDTMLGERKRSKKSCVVFLESASYLSRARFVGYDACLYHSPPTQFLDNDDMLQCQINHTSHFQVANPL